MARHQEAGRGCGRPVAITALADAYALRSSFDAAGRWVIMRSRADSKSTISHLFGRLAGGRVAAARGVGVVRVPEEELPVEGARDHLVFKVFALQQARDAAVLRGVLLHGPVELAVLGLPDAALAGSVESNAMHAPSAPRRVGISRRAISAPPAGEAGATRVPSALAGIRFRGRCLLGPQYAASFSSWRAPSCSSLRWSSCTSRHPSRLLRARRVARLDVGHAELLRAVRLELLDADHVELLLARRAGHSDGARTAEGPEMESAADSSPRT